MSPRLETLLCFWVRILLVAVFLLSPATVATATLRLWNIGTGYNWNVARNWFPTGVPQAADAARIVFSDGTLAGWDYNSDCQTNVPAGVCTAVATVALIGVGIVGILIVTRRRSKTSRAAVIAALATFGIAAPAWAQFDNSLWIGTDNVSSRMVLNTDRSGAVLRQVGPVEATGFAIDLAADTIYFGTSTGGIRPRDLTTLAPGSSFTTAGTEDMTYDGRYI
jgi:hypothetical protein